MRCTAPTRKASRADCRRPSSGPGRRRLIEAEEIAPRDEAWAAGRPIATRSEYWRLSPAAYRATGAVGEDRNRPDAVPGAHLPFPAPARCRWSVKGPSSGGKSFTVETVLRFFPPQAVYCMTAISDRALAYTEAELQHRFLVMFEAAGMVGEFASYLIRSLLSEGRLIYEVVEKTAYGSGSAAHRKGGADRTHGDHHGGAPASGERDPAAVAAGHRHAGTDPGGDAGDRAAKTPYPIRRPGSPCSSWIEQSEHRVVIPYGRNWRSASRRWRFACGATSDSCWR